MIPAFGNLAKRVIRTRVDACRAQALLGRAEGDAAFGGDLSNRLPAHAGTGRQVAVHLLGRDAALRGDLLQRKVSRRCESRGIEWSAR